MPAEEITTTLQQPIDVTAAQTATVTDDGRPGSAAVPLIGSGDLGVYRLSLVPAVGAAGTETNPYSLLGMLGVNLGANWQLSLSTTGYVKIRNAGVSVTGAIVWGTATTVRNVLGFASDISALAPGATITAPNHPTHVVYAYDKANETAWDPSLQRFNGTELRDGRVAGRGDNTRFLVKRFDLAAHPYDVNVRATWGRVSSSVYPTDDARILSPSAVPGAVPPWTLFEFFSTCGARRLACSLGEYQSVLTGAIQKYDACYLGLATLNAEKSVVTLVPGWRDFLTWTGIVLRRVKREQL
jgi:hypothetical protein